MDREHIAAAASRLLWKSERFSREDLDDLRILEKGVEREIRLMNLGLEAVRWRIRRIEEGK